MRDLGTPVLPLAFFERIARVFGETAVFAAVYWQDRPVAGGCGFVWADEFEITWAASLTEFNRYAPNMLLYCALMEEMIRRGIAVFNFGRCTPGSGTHRFKQQWGGEEVSLPWVQWSPAGRAEIPSQDGRVYSLATAVWQRLPLFVANHLGPRLARRLP
jgi:CelD/BcsL family acetyltransferase involved in cellulose biosynthesis